MYPSGAVRVWRQDPSMLLFTIQLNIRAQGPALWLGSPSRTLPRPPAILLIHRDISCVRLHSYTTIRIAGNTGRAVWN
jgi:hypothetical protein